MTPPYQDESPDVYVQRFSVSYEYPVHFLRGVFDVDNPLLESALNRLGENRRHRLAVFVDGGLASANPRLPGRIQEYIRARGQSMELAGAPAIVPGGRAAKAGWEPVREVMRTIGDLHMDRQSFVLAVGGGGVLDMVGFATSIVHRGLRLVRVPTTTLAQCDAGIGVKNGMDEHGMKNYVGTFAPPFAVLNDLSLLDTLCQDDWLGGVAEALKVAVIKDRAFLDFLCDHAAALKARDGAAMAQTLRRCAELHLDHIRTSGDPFEFGSARPLDFGHWAGHKIETMSGYAIRHGQAVAIGIAVDTCYAAGQGLLTEAERDRVLTALTDSGLPIWDPILQTTDGAGELAVLGGLEDFREHLGGELTVTLPDHLGVKREVHHVHADGVAGAIEFLHRRSQRGSS